MSKTTQNILLTLLLIVSSIPRFWGLGSSHFYGDETKTLYLDKTIPASIYFLDQRKGPMQFFVTWVMEKLFGGFSEFWIRLPFAIAGLLSIFVFYLLVKKLFDIKVAFLATLLYSFSGFSVAFSRTAQYQSFLMLFGLLGLLLFLQYRDSRRKLFLILSSLAYVLALYCHYDAVFYLVPALFFVTKDTLKEFFIYFVLPIIILVSLFYVPYLYKGYFTSNTVGYLSRRLAGDPDSPLNNSLYTFSVYNPFVLFLLFLIAGVTLAVSKIKMHRFLIGWFLVPFILFTFVFKSPGTHILHYLLPLYIFAAFGWVSFISTADRRFKTFNNSINIPNFYSGRLYYSAIVATIIVVFLQVITCIYVFVPIFGSNYPWVSSKFAFVDFPQAQRKYQLFLYGFPYNRSWKQTAVYLNAQKGARGFYTNDNTIVANYYVKKLDVTISAADFYPQYYVYVYNNQEFKYPDQQFLSHYTLVQKIGSDTDVYKRTVVN